MRPTPWNQLDFELSGYLFARLLCGTGGLCLPHEDREEMLHTRYRVNDLEKTAKFYREVLGLEEVAGTNRRAVPNWSS